MSDEAAKAGELDEVAQLPIAQVVEELVSILGLKETAVIGAVTGTPLVHQWVRAERIPLPGLMICCSFRGAGSARQ